MAAVCGGEVLRDVPFETFLAKLPHAANSAVTGLCSALSISTPTTSGWHGRKLPCARAILTLSSSGNESGHSSWEYLQNVIPAGYKEHQEVA